MKKLIVNADDFGITKGVTDAIIDCHADGIVTSTTLMSNMPSAEYAASRARAYPKLSVGLHLNLTEGRPLAALSKVDNLVDSQGNFLDSSIQYKSIWFGEKTEEQVYSECEAQLLRALDWGLNISHFDSHHRIQNSPIVRRTIIKLHKLYGIAASRTQKGLYWTYSGAKFHFKLKKTLLNLRKLRRGYIRMLNHLIMRKNGLLTPDRIISPNYLIPCLFDPKEQFIQCLKSLPDGICELALHPGYYDEKSTDSPVYNKVRKFDAQIARDENVRNCIKEYDISLISYKDL
jgi:predicted glycoside hydrolase/deacetylase ChbG (UPF0249 family)